MSNMVIDQFSAAAEQYDMHAAIQRRTAQELLVRIAAHISQPRQILELGCGTGLYTRQLAEYFPTAQILACDLSHAMVHAARQQCALPQLTFAVADAQCAPVGSYDLITANAVLHWVANLPGTLARFARSLTADGLFAATIFGPRTYEELDTVMGEVFGHSACVAARRFASRDGVERAMRGAFREWSVEERCESDGFCSVRDQLLHIRHTGTRGHVTPMPWTPQRLARVERLYRERFGAITATYQVFYCEGQR